MFFVSHFSIPGILLNVWLDCSSLYSILAINSSIVCISFYQSIYCGIFWVFFDKFISHRKQQRITPCAYPSETANVNIVSYLPRFLSDKTNISGKIAVSSSPAEARTGLSCPQAFLWLRCAGFSLRCFPLVAELWLWGVRAAVAVACGLSSAVPRLGGSGSGAVGLQWLWHVGSAVQFAGSGARAQSLWHVGSAVRFPGSGAFGLQWLWHVGSAARFPGSGARSLGQWGCSVCGLLAQSLWQWALLDRGLWGLPRSGIEPMSPVLTGRFLTTETGFSAF